MAARLPLNRVAHRAGASSNRRDPTGPQTGAALPRWITIVSACGLFLVVLAVFWPALRGEFVDWDDKDNFLENPHFRGLSATNLRWMFTTFHMGHYQPLSWVTLGLNYALAEWLVGDGMNTVGYHLVNHLFHAGSVVLVYLLGMRLLDRPRRAPPAAVHIAAALAALLFGLHPLRTESVAWLTERRDVQSSFFLLLTVLWYLRATTPGASHRRRWLGLTLVAYTASLLSRAMGVMLPLALLVLDWYPLGRLRIASRWHAGTWRAVLWEKVPFFVLAAATAVLAVIAQRSAGATATLTQHGVVSRLAQSCFGLTFYLWKTLLPVRLSPIYEMKPPLDITSVEYGGPAILVATGAVGLTVLALLGRGRALLAALACYGLFLLPVLGFVQSGNQAAADRYSYLPSVPLMLLLAGAVLHLTSRERLPRSVRVAPVVAGVAVAAVLGTLTWRQCAIWRSTEALWTYAARVSPDSSIAVNGYGWVLWEKGRGEEALAQFRRAVELQPGNEVAHHNIWSVYRSRGQNDELIREYQRSLRLLPNFYDAHLNLGNALMRKGDYAAAVQSYRKAVELRPRSADAHANLAMALARSGDPEAARREYEEALRLQPHHIKARHGLATALRRLGREAEAWQQLHAVLAIDPNYAPARELLEKWAASAATAPAP